MEKTKPNKPDLLHHAAVWHFTPTFPMTHGAPWGFCKAAALSQMMSLNVGGRGQRGDSSFTEEHQGWGYFLTSVKAVKLKQVQ